MGSPDTILRRLIDEGFSGGRLEVADELIAPDVIEHQNYGPGHAPGAEGVKAVMRSLDVIDVVRVRDGRIVEHWGVPDRLGVLRQLGLS